MLNKVKPCPVLGLSKKERQNYSIIKAIRHFVATSEGSPSECGLEMEASRAIEKLLGRSSNGGFFVPTSDLHWQTRTGVVSSAPNLGGALVPQNLMTGDFIDSLRNKACVLRLGALAMTDLVGNIDIPRQSTATDTYWVVEGETIPDSKPTFDLVSLRPKTIASIVPVTRRLLLQSSGGAEAIVRADLVSQIGLGIDKAALVGSGTNNQPLGILNTPGVGVVEIGINGGPLGFSHLVDLETIVAENNADTATAKMAYLTNAKVKGKLKTTQLVTGQNRFLWESSPNPAYAPGTEEPQFLNVVNGYSADSTNQVPGDLAKGNGTNLSAIVFGDFSQLLIGLWGVLEILPNPYGRGYGGGVIEIRAMSDCDIALRHPESFSVCKDVATT